MHVKKLYLASNSRSYPYKTKHDKSTQPSLYYHKNRQYPHILKINAPKNEYIAVLDYHN